MRFTGISVFPRYFRAELADKDALPHPVDIRLAVSRCTPQRLCTYTGNLVCAIATIASLAYIFIFAGIRLADLSYYKFHSVEGYTFRVLGCPPLQQCLRAQAGTPLPNATHSFAAYYQTTGKYKIAMEFVLLRFRHHYPDASLTLYADGDQSQTYPYMQAAAAAYNASLCKGTNLISSALSKGMWFSSASSAMAYARRVAAASYNATWLMLLEDDVWNCGPVNESQLVYHMNGHCRYTYDDAIWRVIQAHTDRPNCYGGCGGFILNSTFLRIAVARANVSFVHAMIQALPRPIASDELLSALFLDANGTIGPIPDYDEGIEKADTHIVVRHQMKHLYPKDPWVSALSQCMLA